MTINNLGQMMNALRSARHNVSAHRDDLLETGVTERQATIQAFKEEFHDSTAGVFEGTFREGLERAAVVVIFTVLALLGGAAAIVAILLLLLRIMSGVG